MKALTILSFVALISFGQTACISEETRQKRALAEESKAFLEKQNEMLMELKANWDQQEQEQALHKEHMNEIYDKYIDNSLKTGATPYAPCYGKNSSCQDRNCSKIIVKASTENDLVASIKKDGKFVRHAYILRGESYTFEVPDGTYQPFFFMGRGWNPDRGIKDEVCGRLLGGFIANENYINDTPVQLKNKVFFYDMELYEKLKSGEQIDDPQKSSKAQQKKYEKEIFDKYINNSLKTGATPYTACYGKNPSCPDMGCSKIIVKASRESDLVASIMQDGKFVRHAYILRGESYTFEVPDGTYQPYFFIGRGWNPERKIIDKVCGSLMGGFMANENYINDKPVQLKNKVVQFDLELLEKMKKGNKQGYSGEKI